MQIPWDVYSLWSGLGAGEEPARAGDPKTPACPSEQELFSLLPSASALRVAMPAFPVASTAVPGPPPELAWGTAAALGALVAAEAVGFGNSHAELSCSRPAVPMGVFGTAALVTELCCDGLVASVPTASVLLAVTPVAVGLLSIMNPICGARPFSPGAGGALVGLWDAPLSPRGSAAGRGVTMLGPEPAAATVSVVALGAGPAGLSSSRAKSVLFLISGAMVSARGSTTSPATQQTHLEMGPQTGGGGSGAWPGNGTEATQAPRAALQK